VLRAKLFGDNLVKLNTQVTDLFAQLWGLNSSISVTVGGTIT